MKLNQPIKTQSCVVHRFNCKISKIQLNYVQFLLQGPTWNQAITATAFSCISSVLYATRVAWTCALTGAASCLVPAGLDVLGSLLIFLVCQSCFHL